MFASAVDTMAVLFKPRVTFLATVDQNADFYQALWIMDELMRLEMLFQEG